MVALANFNPIWFVRGVRILLGTLALCLAAPINAVGAPKELRTPPVGETINVQVMRGGSVRATLKAFEGRGNPLAYKIVAQPEHGQLREFAQADRNQQGFAAVTYVHSDDETSLQDSFAFRAESLVGGGVSSLIKVTVRIVDAPPQLQVTPVVDFSAVAGESDRQQIILANEGGGLLEGAVAPKKPFSVEGSSRFSLGRGDMTNVVIRFSPEAVDPIAPQKISPAPADPGKTVTLRGEALAPFQASAGPLTFASDDTRSAGMVISNASYAPITIDLALTPSELAEFPTKVEIPKKGVAQIPVIISPEKAHWAGTLDVALSNPFYRQDLRIEVPSVPPRLGLVTPELDFRAGNEAVLAVTNSGGKEGRVLLELDPGGRIKPIEGAQNFVVAPGETREIRLRNETRLKVPNPEFLTVQLGADGKVPVPLLFATAQPSPSPTPPEAATPTPSPTPRAMPWKLNIDVKMEGAEGRIFIAWMQAKEGWVDARLETVSGKTSAPYIEESRESNGWWDAIMSWWTNGKQKAQETLEEKKQFFENRLEVTSEEDPEQSSGPELEANEWARAAVQEHNANEKAQVWRITAKTGNGAARKPVSPDFEIDWQGQTLVPAKHQVAEQKKDMPPRGEEGVAEPPQAAKASTPRLIKAARKIEAATVIPERTRATVNLAIVQDPEISGFRLERGEIVAAVDAKTGIPTHPEFVPLAHAGKVTVSAPVAAEHEGKKLTMVVATIEGLKPGTATFWRLVPLSGDKELMPTDEFLVPTAPPWQFPWRPFFLGLLTALMAAVLWLRHKIRETNRR